MVSRLTDLAPDRVGVIGNAAALRQPRAIRNLKASPRAVPADYVVIGQLQRQDEGLRFILHFIRLRDEVHLSARAGSSVSASMSPGSTTRSSQEAERVVRAHLVGPAARPDHGRQAA